MRSEPKPLTRKVGTALEATAPPLGLGRKNRLRAGSEFIHVRRRGVRVQSPHFVLYALPSAHEGEQGRPSPYVRLGITVSRRIGNAVVRNRVKRRVRECFRLRLRAMLPAGAAMVAIALSGAGQLETPTIKAELEAATLMLGKRLKGRQ